MFKKLAAFFDSYEVQAHDFVTNLSTDTMRNVRKYRLLMPRLKRAVQNLVQNLVMSHELHTQSRSLLVALPRAYTLARAMHWMEEREILDILKRLLIELLETSLPMRTHLEVAGMAYGTAVPSATLEKIFEKAVERRDRNDPDHCGLEDMRMFIDFLQNHQRWTSFREFVARCGEWECLKQLHNDLFYEQSFLAICMEGAATKILSGQVNPYQHYLVPMLRELVEKDAACALAWDVVENDNLNAEVEGQVLFHIHQYVGLTMKTDASVRENIPRT
jgi:hypothetical protein